MKTVHKYRIDATISGEIEYSPADPASYTKALESIAAKRKALTDAGATITRDDGRPASVRE